MKLGKLNILSELHVDVLIFYIYYWHFIMHNIYFKKKCNSCGGSDHSTKANKMCKNNNCQTENALKKRKFELGTSTQSNSSIKVKKIY